MALGDGYSLRQVLRGRPSLRRQLQGLDPNRLAQFDAMNQDAKNFKSLYRQRLADFAQNETMAQPGVERRQLEEALRDPNVAANRRDQLNERLRRNTAGFGSVSARFDPYNYGSIAQRQYGSLYRR